MNKLKSFLNQIIPISDDEFAKAVPYLKKLILKKVNILFNKGKFVDKLPISTKDLLGPTISIKNQRR
jgi:hypothetical protein